MSWAVSVLLPAEGLGSTCPAEGPASTRSISSLELMTQSHANPISQPRPGQWLLHDPANPEHHRRDICHRFQ